MRVKAPEMEITCPCLYISALIGRKIYVNTLQTAERVKETCRLAVSAAPTTEQLNTLVYTRGTPFPAPAPAPAPGHAILPLKQNNDVF
jgi:hypothetical protein